MGRGDNIIIFQDTERLYKKIPALKEGVSSSIANQKLILETDKLPGLEKAPYENQAEIVVSKKRSYEAASAYKGQKVCVHNFASASNPGGGVVSGAGAQEECLCRCSTLYPCLDTDAMWKDFYLPHRREHDPIHNDDIIYTPDVTVFKTDTAYPELMDEDDWYQVNVVTCAAPNLRPRPSNSYNSGDGDVAINIAPDELYRIHVKRFRRILDVALVNGNEVVVLGAFGCGAFMNDPHVVAKAAKTVVEEYKHAFKVIEFAVYCSARDERNYNIFESELKNYIR